MYFYTNTSDASDIKFDGSLRFSKVVTAGIILFMTSFSLTIVVLNILVVVTYAQNKYLHVAKHYFILSLAIGDILIGLVPVNSFTPYLIYGYWPFSLSSCNGLLIFCYSVCTISTLTLLTIAMDRFIAVYFPIFHRFNYTKNKVFAATLSLWVIAFLIWTPGMLAHPNHYQYSCLVLFTEHWLVSLITAFLSYYGPLVFTFVAYACISYKLVGRHKSILHTTRKKKTNRSRNSPSPDNDKYSLDSTETSPLNESSTKEFAEEENKDCSNERKDSQMKDKSMVFKDMYVSERALKRNIKSHKRSLRLLLLVIVAFAIAWLPYHVVLTIESTGRKVSIPYWNFSYISGWTNSLFNPFCYAFGNRNFKRAFLSLFGKAKRLQRKISLST